MSTSTFPSDKILITDLCLPLQIALDHWSRPQPSPHSISLVISAPLASPASIDDLPPSSINYSTTSKAIVALCQGQAWTSLEECAEAIASCVMGLGAVTVKVILEGRKVLSGGTVKVVITRSKVQRKGNEEIDRLELEGIQVRCIIGLNPQERLEKQDVVIDLSIPLPLSGPTTETASLPELPHKLFGDAVHDVSCNLLELSCIF